MKTRTLNATQQSVKEINKQNSNSEMIKRHDVKDTPFTIIETESTLFGTMGSYRITEYESKEKKTAEKLSNELKNFNWNRVIQVVMLLTETLRAEELIEKK